MDHRGLTPNKYLVDINKKSGSTMFPVLSYSHINSMWGVRYRVSFTVEKGAVTIAALTLEMHGREIWGIMDTKKWRRSCFVVM